MRVVGVYHDRKHPCFPKVLRYVRAHVKRDDKVALEWPQPLEELLKEPKNDPTAGFWIPIARAALKRGADVLTVEDPAMNRVQLGLYYEDAFGQPDARRRERIDELSFQRTLIMYRQAVRAARDYLFTGSLHAYHLGRLRAPVDIIALSPLKDTERDDAERYFARHPRALDSLVRAAHAD